MGTFVYVTSTFANNVSAYAIDASSGALTQVQGSPFGAGSEPRVVAIEPPASSLTWSTAVPKFLPPAIRKCFRL